jgi:hypothetical protein
MLADNESVLVLTIRTNLTKVGQGTLGDRNALPLADRLLAFASATVTIALDAVRVEGRDRAGDRLVSLELGVSSGSWRQGRLIDHTAGTAYPLRVPTHKVTPPSWLLNQEESPDLRIYLANGMLLRASAPFDLGLCVHEARLFWGDLFWLQPEEDDAAYWEHLASFGIPQQVRLEYAATGEILVQMAVIAAERRAPAAFDVGDYRLADLPLHVSVAGKAPVPGAETYGVGAGSGEHVGWIIAPSMAAELQQLTNEVVGACGEFDKSDGKGGLIIDWYDRAAKKLGTTTPNAFTRVRELLRSAIAVHILPSAVNRGEIPPEMEVVWGEWLKTIFANPSVPPDQRWCTFFTNLKLPQPELGAPSLKGGDTEYQGIILRDLVEKVLQTRYASKVIDAMIKPITYSCWAFDFKADNFRMRLLPGNNILKGFTVTSQGLQLNIAIDRVTLSFDYQSTPADSEGNIVVCGLSLGMANILETQWGDGTLVAKDILLSLDLVPTEKNHQIRLEPKLGDTSHVDLACSLHGFNIHTLGLAETVGAIASLLSDGAEKRLLGVAAEYVAEFFASLDLSFPALFHFEDAPAPVLDTALIIPNPGQAQFIGARLELPADRAPGMPPSLTMPTCEGDFAITLANDYLNGVMAHRLSGFRTTTKPPYFDWKPHLIGASLPDIKLPEGYEPPPEGGKYPADFKETHEEWTIGTPVFTPAALAALPGIEDAIGTIRIPITYRLMRCHYTWVGDVSGPLMAPEWLRRGLKGPIGPGPVSRGELYVDLDHIMTARYGMYRQADGQIVSPAPPALTESAPPHINPSPGWHAVDVGGIIVEWCPKAVATDEHINVQLEATLPAHLNLTKSLSFLPTLDLTYGPLEVALKKATYSPSFLGLQDQQGLFPELVRPYLQQFSDLHPFQMIFHHDYVSDAWPLCGCPYLGYPLGETAVIVYHVMVDCMNSAADQSSLHIEQDGARLKVTFRFFEEILAI